MRNSRGHIAGLLALASLAATASQSRSHEYTVKARKDHDPVVRMSITDGRTKLGKGEKRKARRNGERWT